VLVFVVERPFNTELFKEHVREKEDEALDARN